MIHSVCELKNHPRLQLKVCCCGEHLYSTLRNKHGRLLKPTTKDGYKYIVIGSKLYFVHRLVLETWLSTAPSNATQADHIDRNKCNNQISNLRWCSRSENCKNRNMDKLRASGTLKRGLYGTPVLQCDMQGNILNTFRTCSEASLAVGKHISSGTRIKQALDTDKVLYGFMWKSAPSLQVSLLPEEQFKTFSDAQNVLVSNKGRVIRISPSGVEILIHCTVTDKKLHARDGYFVLLYVDRAGSDVKHNIAVHQAVMRAFGEPQPSSAHVINHVDRNRQNNDINNLRWATLSEMV
jgi:hypothetical protein